MNIDLNKTEDILKKISAINNLYNLDIGAAKRLSNAIYNQYSQEIELLKNENENVFNFINNMVWNEALNVYVLAGSATSCDCVDCSTSSSSSSFIDISSSSSSSDCGCAAEPPPFTASGGQGGVCCSAVCCDDPVPSGGASSDLTLSDLMTIWKKINYE